MEVIEETGATTDADRRATQELFDAVEAHDGRAPLGEAKLLSLHRARGDLASFAARDGHGVLIGFAGLLESDADYGLELVVHPDARDDENVVATGLLTAALEHVAARRGGSLTLFVHNPTAKDEAFVTAAGFVRDRELVKMRRSLPLEESFDRAGDEVATRSFVVGGDEEAWLSLNNRAFRAHREQGNWDVATLRLREEEEWFDPEGFLLAEDDGKLLGFCWTKVDPKDPGSGEIYVIAVDPERQARGLGGALVAAGCRHLGERRCTSVTLFVDGANAAGLRLYSRLGFTVEQRDRTYVLIVAPDSDRQHPRVAESTR